MEVAQPLPDPTCGLYSSPNPTGYLRNALQLHIPPHTFAVRKRRTRGLGLSLRPFGALIEPEGTPTTPREKEISAVGSDAGATRRKVIEVPTSRNKERFSLFEDLQRKTAEARPNSGAAGTHVLLSNFDKAVKRHPLYLKKTGLQAEIYRLLYSGRSQKAALVDTHSTTRDEADCFLASGNPLQMTPSATEPCVSVDAAGLASASRNGRENIQAKDEAFSSRSYSRTRTEEGNEVAQRCRRTALHSTCRGLLCCRGVRDGLCSASLSPRSSGGLRCRSYGDLSACQPAFSAFPDGETGTDISQTLFSRGRFTGTNNKPLTPRKEVGEAYESHLFSSCCARSAEQRSDVAVADSAAADDADQPHCPQSLPEASIPSSDCKAKPVFSDETKLFHLPGDTIQTRYAQSPVEGASLDRGERPCTDRFSHKYIKNYPGTEVERGCIASFDCAAMPALSSPNPPPGGVVASCPQSSPEVPAPDPERAAHLLRRTSRLQGVPGSEALLAGKNTSRWSSDMPGTLSQSDKRPEKSSTTRASSSRQEGLTIGNPNSLKSKKTSVLASNKSGEMLPPEKVLLPTQVARLHMFFLAWKRIATERSLQKDIYLAARRQTERQLLRRCMLSFVQHRERRAELDLKSDICTLHALKHSAARHFTAWIRLFYAASARKAFLKSFVLRGLQNLTQDRQQQSLIAAAAHEQNLKIRVLKSAQEYVTTRHQARAAIHQAATHHMHSMLKRGMYAWCRWHAYMNACIKLLRVASQLEDQRSQRIKPAVFNVWKAETKRSRAETERALARATYFRVGLAFRAWRRRSAVSKLLSSRKREYQQLVQENAFRHWKIAYCACWRWQEEVQRKVRQIRKRRGHVFIRVALTAWRRYTRRRVELSQACASVKKRRKQRLLQNCKTAAFLSTVSRCLSRNAALKSGSKALSIWKAYARQHKRERFINFFFLKQREKNIKDLAWGAWRRLLVSIEFSKKYLRKYTLLKAYSCWRDLWKRRSSLRVAVQTWETRASLMHQARFFEVWRRRACNLHAIKTHVFSAWWCTVRRHKHERMACEKIGQTTARRLLSEKWLIWKVLVHKRRQVDLLSQKFVATRVFKALVSHIQKCKVDRAKVTHLKARSARSTSCRMFSMWLRQVRAKRKTRSACETVMSMRRDYLLSYVFHKWSRAAGLWSPCSSTVKCFSDLFENHQGKERCIPQMVNYFSNRPKEGVPIRRKQGHAWQGERYELDHHVGQDVARPSRSGVAGKMHTQIFSDRLRSQKRLGNEAYDSRERSGSAARTKSCAQHYCTKSNRAPSPIQKTSTVPSNNTALSHLSYFSSEATTASDSLQQMMLSGGKKRLSSGRHQVYMDYFWDGKLLKILSAWRKVVQRRSRCTDKEASRYAPSAADASSNGLNRTPAGFTNTASENGCDISADPATPRFAYRFTDEARCNHAAVSQKTPQEQYRSRLKLREALLYRGLRAKRQAFKDWVAFCDAKNTIVSRLEDEFRAVRCLRRWRQELSKRQSLRALAHVHTHYLSDLEVEWPLVSDAGAVARAPL